jgi:cyclic pyranopterin phosphate synthase
MAASRPPLPQLAVPSESPNPPASVVDRLGRSLSDVGISVSDRGNFSCGYCMARDV